MNQTSGKQSNGSDGNYKWIFEQKTVKHWYLSTKLVDTFEYDANSKWI